ncbi:MAG: signal peptidase II [Candidatus Omnitrophota bacterium]
MLNKHKEPSFLTMINLFTVSVLIVLLDQFSKFIVQSALVPGVPVPVIKGFFYLTLVYNRGAAFGFFQGATSILIFVSLVCIVGIIFLTKRDAFLLKFFGLDIGEWSVRFSLSLILGGAFGNLIDRLRFSCVVDFLDFHIWPALNLTWPAFNLADSAITIGGVMVFLKIIKQERKDRL